MRTNGWICVKTDTAPPTAFVERDDDGNPVIARFDDEAPEWGDPVECWVEVNSDDAEGSYENGEYRRLSLTVLIDSEDFRGYHVRVERDNDDLGEFRVAQRQLLRTVGRTRLYLRQ